MIMQKPAADGEIVSFKLVNGDEIVAKVISHDHTKYTLHKPCLVVPGQRGIGLIQAMFSGDTSQNVEIDRTHIMMQSPTVKEMVSHYISTTTGIQTVSAGGIVT